MIGRWKPEVQKNKTDICAQFQTPPDVCEYMVSLIPIECETVCEPTKGIGNNIRALQAAGFTDITAPDNFFDMDLNSRFDVILGNPPFSSASADLTNAPEGINLKGMRVGYYILDCCMAMSDNVIILMPWFTISDSDVRLRKLKEFGLVSLTALPRKTFDYARIQTVIIQLQKGFKGNTIFKTL